MYFVYIIYSTKLNRFYIGETTDIETRLVQHNSSFFKNSSTSLANDWELKLVLKVDSRKSARTVEKYIKQMKSRKFLENIIHDSAYLDNFIAIVFEKFNINLHKF